MNENENNRNENADVRRIRVIRYEAGREREQNRNTKKKKQRFSGYRQAAPLRGAAGRRGWKQIIEELHVGGIIGTGRQLPFFIRLLQRSGLAAVHRKHSAVIHETGRIRHIPDMLHVDKDPPVYNKETGIFLQLPGRGFEGHAKTPVIPPGDGEHHIITV